MLIDGGLSRFTETNFDELSFSFQPFFGETNISGSCKKKQNKFSLSAKPIDKTNVRYL